MVIISPSVGRSLMLDYGESITINEKILMLNRPKLFLDPPPSCLKRLSKCVTSLLLAATLTGCVNLKAVHDFAAISTEGQTLQAAASELVDSPQRQIRYTTNEKAKKDLELSAAMGKTNQQELVAAHSVIQAYMAALATLASDGIIASNNAVAGLNKQLADSKLFAADAGARDAFGKVAELVSKAATDFYRQAKLREMIKQAAPHFPVAIAALQQVVTNECVLMLQGELDSMNQYYREQSGLEDSATPKWAVVLVEETRQDRKSTVEEKIRVCQQYGVVLGKIADGHAAMAKNLNHLDAKELVSTLEGYQQEISAVYDAFKKPK